MLGALPHPPLAPTLAPTQPMYLLERNLPAVVSWMGLVCANDHCLTNVTLSFVCFILWYRQMRPVSSVCNPFCMQTTQECNTCKKGNVMPFLTETSVQVTWTLMSQLSRCPSSHMTKTSLSKSHMAEARQGPLLHPHHTLLP